MTSSVTMNHEMRVERRGGLVREYYVNPTIWQVKL